MTQGNSYLKTLEEVLKDLTLISEVTSFAIRDMRGNIICGNDNGRGDQKMDYPALFTRIAATHRAQSLEGTSGETVWGIPMYTDSDDLKSFVTIHTDTPYGISRVWNNGEAVIALIEKVLKIVSVRQSQEKELDAFAEELSQRYEELNFINLIGSKFVQIANFKTSLDYILNKALEQLNIDLVFIDIPCKDIFASTNSHRNQDADKGSIEKLARSLTPELLTLFGTTSDYLTKNDLREYPDFPSLLGGYADVLITPLIFDKKVQGVLLCGKVEPGSVFGSNEVRMTSLLSEVTTVKISNAELFASKHNFLLDLMKSFVSAIEEKDRYTSGHSSRVSRIALAIGEELTLDEAEVEMLNYSSLLHDIGKIGIPETILNKPGALTDDEYVTIKSHPFRGYKILSPITQLENCLPSILHHHERVDGKGYPHGLSGSDIPFHARIIAVADTYDAMTSDRSYRKAMNGEEARRKIGLVSGTQLDSDITRVFLEKCIKAAL